MLSPHTRASSLQKPRSLQHSISGLAVLIGLSCTILCTPGAHKRPHGALVGILRTERSAIVGAPIKATSETTGETRTVSSGTNSSFLVALLLPGLYQVEVAQSGFKAKQFTHVQIFVTERKR